MPSDWEETEDRLGNYSLGARFQTRLGTVRKGIDEKNRNVGVKIIRKCDVFMAGDVESIYREFRFIAGFVRHPNIVRGLDCFHSPLNVYIVMEFVGQQNLSQYLCSKSGQQLNEEDSMSW